MLVQNSIYKNKYIGDGITTKFPYQFPVLDASHIQVWRQTEDQSALDAAIVPSSEYSVSGAGESSGGDITFTVAPPAGTKITVMRSTPITQLYKYTELDSFPAASHENALAKLTLISQELSENLSRAIVVSPTDDQTPEELRDNIFKASDDSATSAEAAKASEDAAKVSETNAANSASAAADSAEAAATSATKAEASEANAKASEVSAADSANSAAADKDHVDTVAGQIFNLQITVTTLNPGEQAVAEYDPATGILHLGLPKGDSGAAAIATPTSLGSVMPQTGDNDGLDLGADGTLRVRKATAMQMGGVVLSSSLDSASEETSATSASVKQLNDEKFSKSGGTLSGSVQENMVTLSGAAPTIDLSQANTFAITVTENADLSAVVFTGRGPFELGALILTNGGNFEVTWPASFKWADGVPPALTADGSDVITFFTTDGGTTVFAMQSMAGLQV